MKSHHLWIGLASSALAVVILLGVRLTQAATPSAPHCPSTSEEAFCIAAEHVHSSDAEVGPFLLSTRYVVTNEVTETLMVHQSFYDLTGTMVFSQATPLSAEQSVLSYPVYDIGVPKTYTGTLVITGTGPFTVQTIDPYTGGPDCLSNAITGRCDFAVYLTAGAERYTLYNTDFLPITQTHEIYRDNVFVTRQLHEVPPYSKRAFTVPTPSAAAGRAEATEPLRYRVNVKPVREATPTPEPTPTGRTSYVPLVWTKR